MGQSSSVEAYRRVDPESLVPVARAPLGAPVTAASSVKNASDDSLRLLADRISMMLDWLFRSFLFVHLVYGIIDLYLYPPGLNLCVAQFVLTVVLLIQDAYWCGLTMYAWWKNIVPSSSLTPELKERQANQHPRYTSALKFQSFLWIVTFAWSTVYFLAMPHCVNLFTHMFPLATITLIASLMAVQIILFMCMKCCN